MSWDLRQGHVLDVLAGLPAGSVHCCVTSPPYWGLRAYGTDPQVWGGAADCAHEWQAHGERVKGGTGHHGSILDGRNLDGWESAQRTSRGATCPRCGAWRGELGSEPTPGAFVAHLVTVFRAVWRVLRDDGTCWLNIGDSYAGSYGNQGRKPERGTQRPINGPMLQTLQDGRYPDKGSGTGRLPADLKAKDLCLIPERLALAMQADGWYIRSRIAWCKQAPMPESVRDRPTTAWEHIWLLSKQPRYFYDADAVRQAYNADSLGRYQYALQGTAPTSRQPGGDVDRREREKGVREPNPAGANLRNYWVLPPEPYAGCHFATYPTELVRRCVLAGTSAHGCCAACGAPWRRVVVGRSMDAFDIANRDALRGRVAKDSPMDARRERSIRADYDEATYAGVGKQAAGWIPTCHCNCPDRVPATVLDPFAGSGTTLLVADRLGRHGLGIELNSEYVQMATRRLASDAPLVAAVEDAALTQTTFLNAEAEGACP